MKRELALRKKNLVFILRIFRHIKIANYFSAEQIFVEYSGFLLLGTWFASARINSPCHSKQLIYFPAKNSHGIYWSRTKTHRHDGRRRLNLVCHRCESLHNQLRSDFAWEKSRLSVYCILPPYSMNDKLCKIASNFNAVFGFSFVAFYIDLSLPQALFLFNQSQKNYTHWNPHQHFRIYSILIFYVNSINKFSGAFSTLNFLWSHHFFTVFAFDSDRKNAKFQMILPVSVWAHRYIGKLGMCVNIPRLRFYVKICRLQSNAFNEIDTHCERNKAPKMRKREKCLYQLLVSEHKTQTQQIYMLLWTKCVTCRNLFKVLRWIYIPVCNIVFGGYTAHTIEIASAGSTRVEISENFANGLLMHKLCEVNKIQLTQIDFCLLTLTPKHPRKTLSALRAHRSTLWLSEKGMEKSENLCHTQGLLLNT